MDIDTATLASAVFLFLGGAVKGVAGVGLPLVALPLLTTVVSVKTAVGLLVVPIIATNFAQSFEGGRFMPTLHRFWPVIACLVAVIVFGVNALVLIPEPVLYAVMGASIIAFPLAAQICPRLRVAPRHERWAGPLVGALAGLIGGASSLYGPPLFLYLGALRLPKEEFVPAISMLFLSGTLGFKAKLSSAITPPHRACIAETSFAGEARAKSAGPIASTWPRKLTRPAGSSRANCARKGSGSDTIRSRSNSTRSADRFASFRCGRPSGSIWAMPEKASAVVPCAARTSVSSTTPSR